jgi:hypothetical protein
VRGDDERFFPRPVDRDAGFWIALAVALAGVSLVGGTLVHGVAWTAWNALAPLAGLRLLGPFEGWARCTGLVASIVVAASAVDLWWPPRGGRKGKDDDE